MKDKTTALTGEWAALVLPVFADRVLWILTGQFGKFYSPCNPVTWIDRAASFEQPVGIQNTHSCSTFSTGLKAGHFQPGAQSDPLLGGDFLIISLHS